MDSKEWHKAKVAIALKAIILNEDGKVLILQRPQDDYSRPLGLDLVGVGLDSFEDPIDGIRMEIKEETNLEVTNLCPIATASFKEDDGCFTVMIGFCCTAISTDIKLSDEHNSFQYLTVQEVLASNIPDTYKDFLNVHISPAKNVSC